MADDLEPWAGPLLERVIEHANLSSPDWAVPWRLKKLPPFGLVFDSRSRGLTVLYARLLLSHRGFYTCLPGYLFTDGKKPAGGRPRGVAQRMLTLIEMATGRPADWRGSMHVSRPAADAAAARLPAGPRYVGLAPGSREGRKNWPLGSFVALARALEARGHTPVMLIGPQEREALAVFRAGVPNALFPEAEPLDPALGVKRLEFAVALAHRLAAAIANDSGIGHLLGAVGTPLVSLFGPSDPLRWAPFTERGVVVRAQEFGGTEMSAIPVDAALRAAERVLGQS
jgi:ADP-heptose:LPS heptosyltransferase